MDKKIELKNMMAVSNSFFELTKLDSRSVLTIDNVEMISITVCCAFSIEIALKFLYYANNNSKIERIHNIKTIYGKAKKYGLEDYLLKDFSTDEINDILCLLENAFEEFRYLYEQTKILYVKPTLMRDFTLAINKYCNNYLRELLESKAKV